MTEQSGTLAYIAPEILKDKGYKGFSADIWSTGVVLYAMIYGTVPFRTGDVEEIRKLIISGEYDLKDEVSEDVRDLLVHMLEVNPRKRYTITQILSHRWFANYDANIRLFSNEEEEAIAKEFTNERYRNNEIETTESDWFIEQNLDKTQYELTKNITTKSAILAPFNSNATDRCSSDSINKLVLGKRVIKLNPKVKEADRQYERNNNADVDNGVYNKADYANDKVESFYNQDSNEDFVISKISNDQRTKANPSQSKKIQESLLKSLIPKPLVIDEELVKKMEELGYPFEYTMEALNKSLRNYATTTYFLLLSQQHTS